ncbi:MAG: PadR family transcriptional regulator [Candidatus Thorarchaeota archaeon]
MSRVPKGYLRHNVLKLLNEGPLSGSEIIIKIEENTNKRWRPSPGSVYPLLAWLLDSGYTIEVSDQDAGVKRYELTDKGREFLAEHDKRAEEEEERMPGFGPPFMGIGEFPEEARELIKSVGALRRASFHLLKKMRREYSEEFAKEAKALVDEFVTKIDLLTKKTST